MAKKDKVVKKVVEEEEVKEVKVDDWKHGDKVPEGYRAVFTADGYILEKL
tara:strand:+ start:115 stop:264 length:150 start_codon:yes stop_codon:yes gene_type:complete